MALTRVGLIALAPLTIGPLAFASLLALALAASAQAQSDPPSAEGSETPFAPPQAFRPEVVAAPDVWIFSGALQSSHETFSGTLVAGKDGTEFELKLSGGATCDGTQASGDAGVVRLSAITCSDDRAMRALFVPQGRDLKVFGDVGDERFVASAHRLGAEPAPDQPQSARRTIKR